MEYRHRKKIVGFENPGCSDSSTHLIEIKDETQSPLMELEKKERLMLVQRAIDSLPAEQRAVVVLRDIEGLSYEEIARITGYNLGTVKSKLSRARLDLRENLRGVI